MVNKQVKGCKKGVYTRSFTSGVMPYVAMVLISSALRKQLKLNIVTVQTLLVIAYFNGTGETVSRLTTLLFGSKNGNSYRCTQFRLDTLLGKGLIERYDGKYRLSEKGVNALSLVVVEGEGAKLLLEIERKQARSEAARAKRLAKKNGDL